MPVAQEWLDGKFTNKEQRKEVISLDISNNYLSGNLDFREFPKLVSLNCSCNEITSINLSCCPNLIYLDCSNNPITDFDFFLYLNIRQINALQFNLSETCQKELWRNCMKSNLS